MKSTRNRIIGKTMVIALVLSMLTVPVSASVGEQDRTQTQDGTQINDRDRIHQEDESGLRNMLEKMLKEGNADPAEIESLLAQIEVLEMQAKELRLALRERVRNMYTSQEWRDIQAVKVAFEEDDEIRVLDPDSIISKDMIFKFDTPPIIDKGGRTLVPVRALTEAFQANVEWDPLLQKVTISKDETVIELFINDSRVFVNGLQQELDTHARLMNHRTMVPLRFITEVLGLTVKWNADDETIEVIDETLL